MLRESEKTLLDLVIQGRTFTGLLDIGADVCVIGESDWLENGPLQEATIGFTGLAEKAILKCGPTAIALCGA